MPASLEALDAQSKIRQPGKRSGVRPEDCARDELAAEGEDEDGMGAASP